MSDEMATADGWSDDMQKLMQRQTRAKRSWIAGMIRMGMGGPRTEHFLQLG